MVQNTTAGNAEALVMQRHSAFIRAKTLGLLEMEGQSPQMMMLWLIRYGYWQTMALR
jgi:hypothetical protein